MEPDKIRNTITEMIGLKISIGISKMRRPGYGKIDIDDHVIYYTEEENAQHRNGIVRNEILYADGIIMVQLQTKTININIVQVYAPTQDYDNKYIHNFCNNLEEILSLT